MCVFLFCFLLLFEKYNLFRRRILSGYKNIPSPVALTMFEDLLYYADSTKMAVLKVNKFPQRGSNITTIWRTKAQLTGVKLEHPDLQRFTSRGKHAVELLVCFRRFCCLLERIKWCGIYYLTASIFACCILYNLQSATKRSKQSCWSMHHTTGTFRIIKIIYRI